MKATCAPELLHHRVEFGVGDERAFQHQDLGLARILVEDVPRLPNRVFRLITRLSRRLSIGGLVTWLKFWRKKWLSGR